MLQENLKLGAHLKAEAEDMEKLKRDRGADTADLLTSMAG